MIEALSQVSEVMPEGSPLPLNGIQTRQATLVQQLTECTVAHIAPKRCRLHALEPSRAIRVISFVVTSVPVRRPAKSIGITRPSRAYRREHNAIKIGETRDCLKIPLSRVSGSQ